MGNFLDSLTADEGPPVGRVAAKWYWKDPDGDWTLFDSELAVKFEDAYQAKEPQVIVTPEEGGGVGFTVDVTSMTRVDSNDPDGVELEVKRESQRRPSGPVAVSPPADPRMIKIDQTKLDKLLSQEHPDRPGPGTEKKKLCQHITSWKSSGAVDHDCPICLCPLEEDIVVLSACPSHPFHVDCIVHCLKEDSQYLKCPCCGHIYGTRTGTMPEGSMSVSRGNGRLDGFWLCGTITISYSFSDGIQGPNHPNPGEAYTGTSRTAYLPDNKEGNEVLRLLQLAWDRKLTFTIGTSVTNGTSNTVIWNGIHHKTATSGGPTNYGFPDETYLERVTQELKDVGVV